MVKPSTAGAHDHYALGEIEAHRRKLGAALTVNKQNAATKTFLDIFRTLPNPSYIELSRPPNLTESNSE
jgi:hypothetical protein